ncbi:hypothetical protein Ancab_007169 [Ancistrocladus abbreviatus]
MKTDKRSTRMPVDSDPPRNIKIASIAAGRQSHSLARELSQLSNSSLEDYHVRAIAAVPFDWESQPGTPKRNCFQHHTTPPLPPLTPPPSYKRYSASADPAAYNKRSSTAATSSTLRKPNFQLIQSIIFPSRIRKSSQPSSPTLSSSSSASSSNSPSSSRMMRKSSSISVPSSPTRSFENIRPGRSSTGSQKQQNRPLSFESTRVADQAAEDEEDGCHYYNPSPVSRLLPALFCFRFVGEGAAASINGSRSRARRYSTMIKAFEAEPDLA